MVNELFTNEEGTCTITDVEKGELTITVTKTGYTTDTKTVNVEQDAELEFTINRLTRTISFTIKDTDDEAVSGAYITLTGADDETLTYANGNGGTGSSGGSSITNVAYGTYNVAITKDEKEMTFPLVVDEELSSSSNDVVISDKVTVTFKGE